MSTRASLPVLDPPVAPDGRKPPWLKVRAPGGPNYMRLKGLVRTWNLHTVCEEAHCPNIGECWEDATATFMILGDVCTRNCGYCAIAHGKPVWEDREEPERIGRAVAALGLDYVVITSVNRDDLADGGAAHWAATIRSVRRHAEACRVEALIPDFQGQAAALRTVMEAEPHVLNHNTETVPRLYKIARHGGRYERTLELFRRARAWAPALPTKSGIILGLGETREELLATMRDLRTVDVQLLTLGQYLRPSPAHLPVARYYHPDEFAALAEAGRELGFAHVEAGPLVRSSYHAKRQALHAEDGERSHAAPETGHPRSDPASRPPLQQNHVAPGPESRERNHAAPEPGHPRSDPASRPPLQQNDAAPGTGHPRSEPASRHSLQ